MANKQAPGNDAAASPRRVLLAGASGLVGRELLAQCLSDGDVVHAVVRRAPESASRDAATQNRIHWHVVDFNALPKLPRCDVAFCALGTTIRTAGSQAAFRAVDFDAVLAFARAARRAGVARLGVVSALGANAASSNFYSRVKGETEAALGELGFASIVFARPSLLRAWRMPCALPCAMPARALMCLARRRCKACAREAGGGTRERHEKNTTTRKRKSPACAGLFLTRR